MFCLYFVCFVCNNRGLRKCPLEMRKTGKEIKSAKDMCFLECGYMTKALKCLFAREPMEQGTQRKEKMDLHLISESSCCCILLASNAWN